MKKLIFLLIPVIFIITSCVKQASNKIASTENIDKLGYAKMQEHYGNVDRGISNSNQRRSNPNQFYHTCADSWGNESVMSKGMAAEVDVVKPRLGNGKIKSWWISFFTSYVDLQGRQIRDWVQWGYAFDGVLFPAFFRYRWVDGNAGQYPPAIVYSGINVPLAFNTRVRFEIKNIEGTTWWAFSRNGQEVFRADLEFTQSSGSFSSCTESWGNATFSPAVMTYYNDILVNGQWQHIPIGISNTYSWGIEGKNTRPNFIQSQVVMGGNTQLPVVGQAAWLWGKP